MDDPERVDYRRGALVKKSVRVEELPSRPAEQRAPNAELGPGVKEQNVTAARPRDAALERDDAENGAKE